MYFFPFCDKDLNLKSSQHPKCCLQSNWSWFIIIILFMNNLNQLQYNSLFYIQILFITATKMYRKQLRDYSDIRVLITNWSFDPTW